MRGKMGGGEIGEVGLGTSGGAVEELKREAGRGNQSLSLLDSLLPGEDVTLLLGEELEEDLPARCPSFLQKACD